VASHGGTRRLHNRKGAKSLVIADDSVKIITYANWIANGLGIPLENWIPD